MGRSNLPDDLAAELLLAVGIREVLWYFAPAGLQGVTSKALGAALVLVLLSMVHRLSLNLGRRSRLLGAALIFGAWCQLQTLLCSAVYIIEPWPLAPGVGMCSARLDFDLGAAGLLVMAWLAWHAGLAINRSGARADSE